MKIGCRAAIGAGVALRVTSVARTPPVQRAIGARAHAGFYEHSQPIPKGWRLALSGEPSASWQPIPGVNKYFDRVLKYRKVGIDQTCQVALHALMFSVP